MQILTDKKRISWQKSATYRKKEKRKEKILPNKCKRRCRCVTEKSVFFSKKKKEKKHRKTLRN